MATIISYGSQAKIPLDPLTITTTVVGTPGAGAGLATAQVNISPANPASFSSRVELNGSFSLTALANSQFFVIIRRAGVDIYRSFYRFTTTTDIQLNVLWVDGPYLGIHNYELVIQNDSNLPINLFGPIAFTATAIGGEGVI
ncbi:hypothetical protein A3844_08290 [Paenibacillus helianthi]|uniref:Exosporium leader peptide n=1 Tax=Paenibacillus helianthi TaxID=1349432 RepID=A0ABX3ETL9_9BACL|nr:MULTISPECIES: hypothetical protein [Paenibacillus]OKP84851.1 hypothetical protein A3848_23810 [Paenibacillus sp. P32E]OKP88360.1 hypothetical protein A3844_08290 [Paenibacillus helianthi]